VDPRTGANDLQYRKISEFFTLLWCYAAYLVHVLGYRRLGTNYRSHLQRSVCPTRIHATERSVPATSLRRPASRGMKISTSPRRNHAVLKKILFPVTRNEPRFLGFPARNLITDYAVPASQWSSMSSNNNTNNNNRSLLLVTTCAATSTTISANIPLT
jgi:hypothetical protein